MERTDKQSKTVLECVAKHYETVENLGKEAGFTPIATFLIGSQNYNLDLYTANYKSDIDTVCVVVPSFSNIIDGEIPETKKVTLVNNENIYIEDIRYYTKRLIAQSPVELETLFTEFLVVNPKYADLIRSLFNKAEAIARMDVNNTYKTIEQLANEFFTVIEQNKSDNLTKYLVDLYRLKSLLENYTNKLPYRECLIPDNIDFLKYIKECHDFKNPEDNSQENIVEHANRIKNFIIDKAQKNYITSEDTLKESVRDDLINLSNRTIKRALVEELYNE